MHPLATAAALFTLALAAAGPAAAQPYPDDDDRISPEVREAYRRGYERGYDRGYRKGFEEGERRGATVAPPPPPAPPPPRLGPIHVLNATYGSDERSCPATRWVSRLANGKRTFSVKVTNEICGDPHPGKRKSLEVAYTCGQVEKSASARVHQTLYLDCNS